MKKLINWYNELVVKIETFCAHNRGFYMVVRDKNAVFVDNCIIDYHCVFTDVGNSDDYYTDKAIELYKISWQIKKETENN